MKKYRCKLCGYEVEMEEMPIDYKCPICGVSASMFEEVKEEIDNRIPISPNNPAIARYEKKCKGCRDWRMQWHFQRFMRAAF